MPATASNNIGVNGQHKCMLSASAANQPIQLHCMRLSGPIRVWPVVPESIRWTSTTVVTDSPPLPVAKHDFVLLSPVWAGSHCADHAKNTRHFDLVSPTERRHPMKINNEAKVAAPSLQSTLQEAHEHDENTVAPQAPSPPPQTPLNPALAPLAALNRSGASPAGSASASSREALNNAPRCATLHTYVEE